MKMIVAIIRPEKLEAVQQALNDRDVYLITVSDVRGCGRQRGFTEVYRGTEFVVRLLPKLKLEIAVNDAFVEAAVEALVHVGTTRSALRAVTPRVLFFGPWSGPTAQSPGRRARRCGCARSRQAAGRRSCRRRSGRCRRCARP